MPDVIWEAWWCGGEQDTGSPASEGSYSFVWGRDTCWRNIGMKQIVQMMILIFGGKSIEGSLLS